MYGNFNRIKYNANRGIITIPLYRVIGKDIYAILASLDIVKNCYVTGYTFDLDSSYQGGLSINVVEYRTEL